jgi:hypothetical protein
VKFNQNEVYEEVYIIVLLNNGIQFIPKVVQIGVGWKKK